MAQFFQTLAVNFASLIPPLEDCKEEINSIYSAKHYSVSSGSSIAKILGLMMQQTVNVLSFATEYDNYVKNFSWNM